MKKFKRAVFCYLILWAYAGTTARGMHPWIINIKPARRRTGAIVKNATMRDNISDWAYAEFFAKNENLDFVISFLGGDAHYEKNKRDIAKLYKETGKNVVKIFDTDPVFAKYPHLRGFARNREFEVMWKKIKSR